MRKVDKLACFFEEETWMVATQVTCTPFVLDFISKIKKEPNIVDTEMLLSLRI